MNTRSIQRALQAHGGMGGDSVNSREPSMRVGAEFQAVIAPVTAASEEPVTKGVGSVMVWTPTEKLQDEDIDEYLAIAKDKFGYGVEQALGMLYWHGYCIDKALENMPNFCPLNDEWSMEDKVIFQQAFQFHGKNFQRIRAMLPDKPISSLVKYYYLWKRSYSQFSLMDKQARRNVRRLGAGLPVSNDETDSNKSGSSHSHSDPHTYHTTTLLYPHQQHQGSKGKQLPKGMHLNTMELLDLANDEDSANARRLDREILELRKKMQDNKQYLGILREEGGGEEGIDLEAFRPTDFSRKSGSTVPTKWSDEEIEMALQVIKEHGKDSEALSMALESKTINQCRNFFTNYKRKLNLPKLIAEYEIKNGYKLSRYSRQARELVENGGAGLNQQYPSEDQPREAKRACYETHPPQAHYPMHSHAPVPMAGLV